MGKSKCCNNCKYYLQDVCKYPCNVCMHEVGIDTGWYPRWEADDDGKTHEDEPIEDEPIEDEPIEDEHFDSHYSGAVQPIEFMQTQMQPSEFIGFLKGNIIKYIARMGKKDDPAKEVAKIKRYAEWLEKALRCEKINPRD